MVRIRNTAVAAAAVLALAACSSIDGSSPWPGDPGAAIDYARFPPPPPMPSGAPAGPVASDDVAREIAGLRASLKQLSADIDESRRHLAELEAEVEGARARIDSLLFGQASGNPSTAPIPEQRPADRRPLVRIRYGGPGANYADALEEAVATALARLPEAVFDLIAVTPAGAGTEPAAQADGGALLHAQEVMASLLAMGIEPDRLSLSSATSEGTSVGEIHLYIR